MSEWDGRTERRSTNARRARLALGGAGGGIGSLIAVVAAFVWEQKTGAQMGDQVAMAIGGLLGAFCSTVAICVHDVRDIILSIVHARRRKPK